MNFFNVFRYRVDFHQTTFDDPSSGGAARSRTMSGPT